MKYIDLPVFFYTVEQEKLPEEERDKLKFSDMQVRLGRFYEPPSAVLPSMEEGKVCASMWHTGGDKFFVDMLPLALHEKIENMWGESIKETA